jgi:hypothetical protein
MKGQHRLTYRKELAVSFGQKATWTPHSVWKSLQESRKRTKGDRNPGGHRGFVTRDQDYRRLCNTRRKMSGFIHYSIPNPPPPPLTMAQVCFPTEHHDEAAHSRWTARYREGLLQCREECKTEEIPRLRARLWAAVWTADSAWWEEAMSGCVRECLDMRGEKWKIPQNVNAWGNLWMKAWMNSANVILCGLTVTDP